MKNQEDIQRKECTPRITNDLSAPINWTNDDSKFGQHMLAKFGWIKGSGIKKNKQVTPTELKEYNEDDWFKAGEDYSRLLSQLTEKFNQYQTLSKVDDTNSKQSLIQKLLNSKSREHYHKHTKRKNLTQHKIKELAYILDKGIKYEDQSLNGLDTKDIKNKTIQIDKHNKSSKNNSTIFISNEINTTSSKNLKCQSKLTNKTDLVINNESNKIVQLNKKSKSNFNENIDDVEISRNKKFKTRINNYVDNIKSYNNRDSRKTSKEQFVEFVLTYKYQNLVDLLINNSSAGKKYCEDSPSPLFEKKIKEFADSTKEKYLTTFISSQMSHLDEESLATSSKTLDLNYSNFVEDFKEQKPEVFDRKLKWQEMLKYKNEKSMFIVKHGNVLFFGSNINDIKGYGEW